MDHVGLVVPDLDEAVAFFTQVIGCDLLYHTGVLFDSTGGDWMSRHFAAPARARLRTAMLRCGPSANIELLEWDIPDRPVPISGFTAIGTGHLAIYVDDVGEAAAHLAAQPGVRVLGSPTIVTGEPHEGTQFVYVILPWGLGLELVRWPPLMPYRATTTAKLVEPAPYWWNARRREEPPNGDAS